MAPARTGARAEESRRTASCGKGAGGCSDLRVHTRNLRWQMKLSFLAVALPHAAAFAVPTLLRPRLPAPAPAPALVLEHAAPVLDNVTTSLAFADQAGNLAGALFPASLPPYLLFLYFICQDVNGLSAEAGGLHAPRLRFCYWWRRGSSRQDLRPQPGERRLAALGGGAAALVHQRGQRDRAQAHARRVQRRRRRDAGAVGRAAGLEVLPAIGGTAALFFAATWAAAGFDLGEHSAYLGGIGNLPDGVWTLGSFDEPANALSLPTWVIHVSSLLEWLVAMGLVWRMAEASGNPRWKGLTWAMIPSHSSGVYACVYHFFYNAPSLQFVVLLQAALTLLGNCTSPLRRGASPPPTAGSLRCPRLATTRRPPPAPTTAPTRRRRRRRRRGRRRRGGGRVGRRGGRAAADPRAVDRRELRDQIRRDAAPLCERRRLARGARRRHAHDPRRHRPTSTSGTSGRTRRATSAG